MEQNKAPDLRPQLFEALAWYTELVTATTDEQLRLPTPDEDFDVRLLMAHMFSVIERLEAFGTQHCDPLAGHREPQDVTRLLEERASQVVDDATVRVDEICEGVVKAQAAWAPDAILDTEITLGWGPVLPGRVVSGIYLMEVLAHGWDLATATGQPAEAPATVAIAGLEAAKQAPPEEGRQGFPFGAVVTPAADAGPTEQLANWTGRRSR